jgi:yecA family protein
MRDQLLNTPLFPEEYRQLSLILNATPGAPDLVEMDGFFHGVLSLPRPIMPSEWLPQLFPNTTEKSITEVEQLINLVFRYHNRVADLLLREQASPNLDGSLDQTERWMSSFTRGVMIDPSAFLALGNSETGSKLGTIIFSYGLGTANLPEALFAGKSPELLDELREARDQTQQVFATQTASENLEMLTTLATGTRQMLKPAKNNIKRTSYRAGRKIGPNELCPCGSGLKYKRCCGRP